MMDLVIFLLKNGYTSRDINNIVMDDKKIQKILLEAKECISTANQKAKARYDNINSDFYMDGAQYEIMQDTQKLLDEINSILGEEKK